MSEKQTAIWPGQFQPRPGRTLWITTLVGLSLFAGCTTSGSLPGAVMAKPTVQAQPSLTAAATLPPTVPPTITATATLAPPTATPTPAFSLCSPLEGITLSEALQPDLLKNPFVEPRPGMDDGHHGIDLAYWSRGDRKTMVGLPIHSALNGKVAAVLPLRKPYGNAVIIETPLQNFPAALLASLSAPTAAPTIHPPDNLFCPPDPHSYAAAGQSLYVLYAHMVDPSPLKVGQEVACGDPIGGVGTTGNSVNPHLHFETRVGPSGAVFASMGHYDASYTADEMATYCTWRVSGLFQMFDPVRLLSLQP
jgi:murein DD-endopeptidase MepM/ murein hydrolase activator NlpD